MEFQAAGNHGKAKFNDFKELLDPERMKSISPPKSPTVGPTERNSRSPLG